MTMISSWNLVARFAYRRMGQGWTWNRSVAFHKDSIKFRVNLEARMEEFYSSTWLESNRRPRMDRKTLEESQPIFNIYSPIPLMLRLSSRYVSDVAGKYRAHRRKIHRGSNSEIRMEVWLSVDSFHLEPV